MTKQYVLLAAVIGIIIGILAATVGELVIAALSNVLLIAALVAVFVLLISIFVRGPRPRK